jgi:hypothetical protein
MDAQQSLAPLARSCSASFLALASNTFHAHLDRAARICTLASVKGTSIHRCAGAAYLLVYILHLSLGLAPQGPRYERNLRSGPDPLR